MCTFPLSGKQMTFLFHRGRKVKREKMELMDSLEYLYVEGLVSNGSVDMLLYCRDQRGLWDF